VDNLLQLDNSSPHGMQCSVIRGGAAVNVTFIQQSASNGAVSDRGRDL